MGLGLGVAKQRLLELLSYGDAGVLPLILALTLTLPSPLPLALPLTPCLLELLSYGDAGVLVDVDGAQHLVGDAGRCREI